MITPFSELKMYIRYSFLPENMIQSIILVKRNQDKIEISHKNPDVLRQIMKNLKLKIKMMYFYEHFMYVDKLWKESSIDVDF